jgi:hypothetical protein
MEGAEDPLLVKRWVQGEQQVPGGRAAAVENDLVGIRDRETLGARDVAMDQELDLHRLREGSGIGLAKIPSPQQLENGAMRAEILLAKVSGQLGRVKTVAIHRLGQTVADEHPVIDPHGQRATAQKQAVGSANGGRLRSIELIDSQSELQIQHAVPLGNGEIGHFGQLMIPQQEVHATGKLGHQLDHIFQEEMGHAASPQPRIAWPSMADFLEDQMPPGLCGQVGSSAKLEEVEPMAVEVGRDQHIVGLCALEVHQGPAAVDHLPIHFGSPLAELDDTARYFVRCHHIGHSAPGARRPRTHRLRSGTTHGEDLVAFRPVESRESASHAWLVAPYARPKVLPSAPFVRHHLGPGCIESLNFPGCAADDESGEPKGSVPLRTPAYRSRLLPIRSPAPYSTAVMEPEGLRPPTAVFLTERDERLPDPT